MILRDSEPHPRRAPLAIGISGILVPAGVGVIVTLLSLESGAYSDSAREALAIATLWTLVVGVGLGVFPRTRVPRAAWLVGGLITLFCAGIGVSAAWAEDPERVLAQFDRGSLYLALYALAVAGVAKARLRRVVWGLVLGIVAVTLIALVRRLFPEIAPAQADSVVPALGSRLSYPLGYWNGLAILVALALPLLAGLVLAAPRRRHASLLAAVPAITGVIVLSASRGGLGIAVLALLTVVLACRERARGLALLIACGLAATLTFLVLDGRPSLANHPQAPAAVGEGHSAFVLLLLLSLATPPAFLLLERLLLLAAASPPLRRRSVRAGLLALAVLAATAVLAAAHPVARAQAFARVPDLRESLGPTYVQSHLLSGGGSGRWQMWTAALDEFRARPLTGDGAGGFQDWWTQRRPFQLSSSNPHSLYLQSAAELGLVGLLPLLVLIAGAGWCVASRVRRARGPDRALQAGLAGLLAGYAAAVAIDWMWEMTIVSAIAFFVAGLALGGSTAPPELRVGRDLRRGRRLRLGAAGVLVAWLLLCAQALPFLAQSRLRASVDAAAAGSTASALAAAREAQRLEPWAASPRLQLALLDEASGRLAAASGEIGAAIRRDGRDWRLWLVSARIAAKRERIGEARQALARARELNPLLALAARPG